jgi:SAM-dependent methyltransferase
MLGGRRGLRKAVLKIVPERPRAGLKRLWFRARAPFYAGDAVVCPCCGGGFRSFLTDGIDRPRRNARCPRCGAWERHRALRLFLERRTNLFTGHLRVLHVAPEHTLQKTLGALPNLDYVSADLSSPLASVKMDVREIPYGDGWFDVVLCNHVLEHVPEDALAMKELFRVLKPAGWAILQVPIKLEVTFEDPAVVSPEERERVFGQRDHVRIYGRDYVDRLEGAGFRVTAVRWAKELGEEESTRFGLEPEEEIFFCTPEARTRLRGSASSSA